jgi:hypothetical protein
MLFLLISLTWVALVLTVMAVCRIAAHADALAPPSTPPALGDAPLLSVRGLTVWDCADPSRVRRLAVALSSGAPTGARRPQRSCQASPSSGYRLRAGRERGARHAA